MPKSLEKTRKRIAKKRNGNVVLHEFSRDTKKLHKAQVRDERLEKLAAARKKHDQPLIHRITFFQKAAQENESIPFDMEKMQEYINQYVHQHDQELEQLKKSRRPGRPASVKEDLLSLKVETLRKEQQNGFYLSKQNNIDLLNRWEGAWSFLATMSYIRISEAGTVKPSSFPPSSQ
ncbi:hypothetical protein J7T55_004135 [Diaporthe amygdali]|uniref:uncharacterized protein n=1 Tax=Phomopsis amygdali TaxID=1214568 RepID=UPI0022FDFE2D|nr:uncharacterized protein J7T55_004135 [Diaporthe amygdali]KAJ0115965.1 hypothetical protein J7T55_004135 [Diaporthe amygdali]